MGLCVLQVPLVPFVPGASILLNVFLMLKLSALTWLRFTIWLAAGTGQAPTHISAPTQGGR